MIYRQTDRQTGTVTHCLNCKTNVKYNLMDYFIEKGTNIHLISRKYPVTHLLPEVHTCVRGQPSFKNHQTVTKGIPLVRTIPLIIVDTNQDSKNDDLPKKIKKPFMRQGSKHLFVVVRCFWLLCTCQCVTQTHKHPHPNPPTLLAALAPNCKCPRHHPSPLAPRAVTAPGSHTGNDIRGTRG